jgi:hypothetical protein
MLLKSLQEVLILVRIQKGKLPLDKSREMCYNVSMSYHYDTVYDALRDLLFLTNRILDSSNDTVLSRVIRNTTDELSRLRHENTRLMKQNEILSIKLEQAEAKVKNGE